MEQTIKERVMLFVKSKGISINKFELNCGISQGYFKNLKKTVGEDNIRKILEAYPELNQQWLLTGEGEMLKRVAVDSAPPFDDLQERLNQLQKERDELKQQNADQASLIKTLQKAMELMQDTIEKTKQ